MKTSDFDYQLDPARIAQTPMEPRDASRLMVVKRADRSLAHRRFRDIGGYLSPGDLLIFNDTRVIAARLFARKLSAPRAGAGAPQPGGRVELLLLKRHPDGGWHALVKGKRVRQGTRLALLKPGSAEPAGMIGTVAGVGERGERHITFDPPLEVGPTLDSTGVVPLPPYIHAALDDPERYQTVYARRQGSAAAPTAGLHFTPDLLLGLREKGVEFGFCTLHIGLDTFRPVAVENVHDHPMHSEFAALDPQTAEQVNQAKLSGRRVIAVGTTAVRVLESAAQRVTCSNNGALAPVQARVCAWQTVAAFTGETDLFITPGYRFRVVDALITNFHLPRSTLLMLVSAFAGLDLIQQAYRAAIDYFDASADAPAYRFYSLGDAMLIL